MQPVQFVIQLFNLLEISLEVILDPPVLSLPHAVQLLHITLHPHVARINHQPLGNYHAHTDSQSGQGPPSTPKH